MRWSLILRSSTISMFPVPLNSWKISSSMRLPVSIRAVATMVSEPASSVFRAAAKILRGISMSGGIDAHGIIEGASRARDGVEQDKYMFARFDQPFGALDC